MLNLYSRTDTYEKWTNNYRFGLNDCSKENLVVYLNLHSLKKIAPLQVQYRSKSDNDPVFQDITTICNSYKFC